MTKTTTRGGGRTRVESDYKWRQDGDRLEITWFRREDVPVGYTTSEIRYDCTISGDRMIGRGVMIDRTYGAALGRLSGAPRQDYRFAFDVKKE